MLRLALTLLTFAASFATTAAIAFFAVFVLAGPHGALPQPLHGATLAIGWFVVLVLPASLAIWTWRRTGRRADRRPR